MKAVVLHSGGLDSTVCVLMAQRGALPILSLGFDYNQSHRIELEYAAAQCDRFGVPRKVIRIEWDKPIRTIPQGRGIEQIRASGVSPAFLPGRNMVFLALGLAEASGIGAEELWIGVNSIDYSGYPDCREDFINAFSSAAELAVPKGPRVIAPLQNLSKPEIARIAHEAGLGANDTWSCYRPVKASQGFLACNNCDACKLHAYAWQTIKG